MTEAGADGDALAGVRGRAARGAATTTRGRGRAQSRLRPQQSQRRRLRGQCAGPGRRARCWASAGEGCNTKRAHTTSRTDSDSDSDSDSAEATLTGACDTQEGAPPGMSAELENRLLKYQLEELQPVRPHSPSLGSPGCRCDGVRLEAGQHAGKLTMRARARAAGSIKDRQAQVHLRRARGALLLTRVVVCVSSAAPHAMLSHRRRKRRS